MRVLVVEDDPNLLEGLIELVSELGAVRGARTVPEVLSALQSDSFSLVLTDLTLGNERDGGERIIQAAHATLAPVALVTGAWGQKLKDLHGNLEADAVIGKPFGAWMTCSRWSTASLICASRRFNGPVQRR